RASRCATSRPGPRGRAGQSPHARELRPEATWIDGQFPGYAESPVDEPAIRVLAGHGLRCQPDVRYPALARKALWLIGCLRAVSPSLGARGAGPRRPCRGRARARRPVAKHGGPGADATTKNL